MKKNRMLRLASALLILTLLTTSVIGGTFAKYVSTGSVSDTARVAKWGVEIKTSGTLYSDAYATKSDTDGNLPAAFTDASDATKVSVVASAETNNIVAPGTKSYANGLSFAISGKPDVAVKVKANIEAEDIFLAAGTYGVLEKASTVVDKHSFAKLIKDHTVDGTINVFAATTVDSTTTYARVATSDEYSADKVYYILADKITLNADYFPVEYKLEGSTKNTDGNKSKTASGIADILAKAIKNDAAADSSSEKKSASSNVYKTKYLDTTVTANFAANTDLGTAGPQFKDEKLTWEWKFEADDTDTTKNDPADTILGDLMAMRAAQAATPSGTVDYKIVQIIAGAGGAADTIKELTVKTDTDDYTVVVDTTVVANLRTLFDIELTVEQVD